MGMSSGNGDVGEEEREAGAAESGAGGEEAEGTQLMPEVEEGAAERLEELERELARVREELVSVKEERMRLMGSVERLLRHLIGVAETVERVANLYSLSDDSNARSLSEGLRLVSITIEKALREEGVEVIGNEGERFDPELHEAVGFVESEQHEDGTVVSVMERGFAFRGKVLRPAKVIVAKRVSKEERKDGE
jgi:molecular chaperone GrpE